MGYIIFIVSFDTLIIESAPDDGYTNSSTMWRNKGNKYYKTALSGDLDFDAKEEKLRSAIHAYRQAMDKADEDHRDEYSSAAKNYAMASWRFAELFGGKEGKLSLVRYHYALAFEYFSIAAIAGREWKTQEWKECLNTSYFECVKGALTAAKKEDERKDRVKLIEAYITHMSEGATLKADCYVEIATILFQMSVVALQVSCSLNFQFP